VSGRRPAGTVVALEDLCGSMSGPAGWYTVDPTIQDTSIENAVNHFNPSSVTTATDSLIIPPSP